MIQLRQKRIERGWTLEYVGQRVDLGKTAIQNIEVGRAKPSFNALMKLCKLFEVQHAEVEQLFAEASDQEPS